MGVTLCKLIHVYNCMSHSLFGFKHNTGDYDSVYNANTWINIQPCRWVVFITNKLTRFGSALVNS